MSNSPVNEVLSPSQPPTSGTREDIATVIEEIDELMKKQTSSENKRQEALATTTAAHREIDLAQDLLHTSLQRIANVDDDTFYARNVLATKEEALKKTKTKKFLASEERQKLEKEASEYKKIIDQQGILLADLQRKLLQSGKTPESILKLQKEARDKIRHIYAEAICPEEYKTYMKEQQREQPQQQKPRRKMKFPLFGKAS